MDNTDLIALVFLWFSYSSCVLQPIYMKAMGGRTWKYWPASGPGLCFGLKKFYLTPTRRKPRFSRGAQFSNDFTFFWCPYLSLVRIRAEAGQSIVFPLFFLFLLSVKKVSQIGSLVHFGTKEKIVIQLFSEIFFPGKMIFPAVTFRHFYYRRP